jgi:uncharacterized membrane protein
MKRMLVVIFDSEEKAYEAARALETLSEESMIAVYDDVVVKKDSGGTTTSVVKTHDTDPQGTMGGTAVGSLIGLLGGGPIGLAVGATTGFVLGAAADVARARLGRHFVREVADALAPGHTAPVAEIDEEDTDPVDSRMRALGGSIFRSDLSDVADADGSATPTGLEKRPTRRSPTVHS